MIYKNFMDFRIDELQDLPTDLKSVSEMLDFTLNESDKEEFDVDTLEQFKYIIENNLTGDFSEMLGTGMLNESSILLLEKRGDIFIDKAIKKFRLLFNKKLRKRYMAIKAKAREKNKGNKPALQKALAKLRAWYKIIKTKLSKAKTKKIAKKLITKIV